MLKSKRNVPIHVSQSLASDTVLIEESLLNELGIPKAEQISIQFGIYKQTIKVMPESKRKGLFMHSRLAQLLGIPLLKNELQLTPYYQKERATLKLGPLLAVMINKETPEDVNRPFASLSNYCNELAEACANNGAFVYFFTPDSLLQRHTLISGWVRDGEWKKLMLPLPEVIYNRLPTRQTENRPQVRRLIQETAKLYAITIFNERFLDKHEVFQLLSNDSDVKDYLPHSVLFQNMEQLQQMLGEHQTLYLKPVQGSSGRGIYRITTLSDRTYGLERTSAASKPSTKFKSLKKMFRIISPKLKQRKYQLQQGLSVIQVGNKPVDFRALVQKNGQGNWTITSIVARTAGDEQFVANIARGGSIQSVMNTLPITNLQKQVEHESIHNELKEVALKIAKALDNQLNEHFAEFGVDLALDVQGRIWLIEVNSKPSKIDKSTVSKKIRPSVRMLLAYTNFLTGCQKEIQTHGKSSTGRSRRKN